MPGNIPGKRTVYRVTEGIGIRQGMDGAGGSSQGKTIISKCRILDTGRILFIENQRRICYSTSSMVRKKLGIMFTLFRE